MEILGWVLVALLAVGVPAGMVYAFLHHRRRDSACRRVARRHGFRYRSRTGELCDTGLAALERFAACRPGEAARAEFRFVLSRADDEGTVHVFDYRTHSGGTPGSPGGLFHGTWSAVRREGRDLPVFALTPTPPLRPALAVRSLPEPYAAWGQETEEGEWAEAGAVRALLSRLSGWLRREREAGRSWHLEGGGPWVAARRSSTELVERHRHVPAEEMPALLREGREAAEAVGNAWEAAR